MRILVTGAYYSNIFSVIKSEKTNLTLNVSLRMVEFRNE